MSDAGADSLRIAALARYDITDSDMQAGFDRIEQILVVGLGMPIANVTFLDDEKLWLKETGASQRSWAPRESALCHETLGISEVIVIPDLTHDEHLANHPLVTGFPFLRFYANAPIFTPDGFRIGSVCVASPQPYYNFDNDKQIFLSNLASTVMSGLEIRRMHHQQAAMADDSEFWSRLSKELVCAKDFSATIQTALTFCTNRIDAAVVFLVRCYSNLGVIEYIKYHLSDTGSLVDADVTHLFGQHKVSDFSFGIDLAGGHIADTGPLTFSNQAIQYPTLRPLIAAGIKRQLTFPFDLLDQRFGLVMSFSYAEIPAETFQLAREFITRLSTLMMGKLREDSLDRANRALRTLNGVNAALADATCEQDIFQAICQLAVDTGHYNTCWVGLAESNDERTIAKVASAGIGKSYVEGLKLSWANVPTGQGPAGTAIREGRIVRYYVSTHDQRYAIWRELVKAHDFKACLAIPFGSKRAPAAGVVVLYSSNPAAFDTEEQALLLDVVNHMEKALDTIQFRQQRDAAVEAQAEKSFQIDRLLHASRIVLYSLSMVDGRPVPRDVSPNIIELLGFNQQDFKDPNWWKGQIHEDHWLNAAGAINRVLQTGSYTHRYKFRHRSGEIIWIRDEMTLQRDKAGNPVSIVGVWADITASILAEDRIHELAYSDPLTGLPNRLILNERIESALTRARVEGTYGALLFIDLNRFKTINDMLGHAAGDIALNEVALRLKNVLRRHDLVARIGGDEFVVLIEESGLAPENAVAGANYVGYKILEALEQKPLCMMGYEYHLGASIGYTIFPKDGDDLDTLVREADTAMYHAKSGDTNVVMFQSPMLQSITARFVLEEEIRLAIKEDRFQLWLQPQVDRQGHHIGAEVLVRLQARDGTIMSPASFIEVAEISGLIVAIGRLVLRDACRLLAQIHREQPAWRLSVNISPRQFRDPSFVSDVIESLNITGAPADRLTFEVTENLLIENIDGVSQIMKSIVDLGIRFSIDDFGTGYSNLHYLQQLPIHEIKIDKSFIAGIPHNVSSIAIIDAVLALAGHLGLDVVAEGVETEAQVNFLSSRTISKLQGYHFGRPTAVSITTALA